MVLNQTTIKKINEFVCSEPRTVQEVAFYLKKNWRTADSYLRKISEEVGTISFKVLRGGTRGAVKIVYWNNVEKPYASQAQERLLRQLEIGKKMTDFSPFDIYQYLDDDKRSSFFEEQGEEIFNIKQDLVGSLRQAQQQVLIFSGGINWSNIKQGDVKLLDVFEELAKRDVSIKFLANIDITSIENAKKMIAINNRIGKDRIAIRHCEQPLRSFIVDNSFAKMKEIKDPKDIAKPKKMYIFYELYDADWVKWIGKIFFHFFSTAIPFEKRVQDLKTVKKL
ncbi:MAG: hypothetical protein U9Q69_04380 [Nanoarchaeota archaeon]|nr:hypothetical protein [Nanoarchaeota archaeon]